MTAHQEQLLRLPNLVHRASKYLETLARNEGVELPELLRHVCLSLNVGLPVAPRFGVEPGVKP